MHPLHRTLCGALGCAAALAAPAAASAATITPSKRCYVERTPMSISGTGFSPGGRYELEGFAIAQFGNADAAGNFVTQGMVAPGSGSIIKPKRFLVTAQDNGTVVAHATFHTTPFAVYESHSAGNPRRSTTWRFAGFAPHKRIYVHVMRGGKLLHTARAGKSRNACGTLKRRLPRLPLGSAPLRSGNYKIVVDNSRHHRAHRRHVTFAYRVF